MTKQEFRQLHEKAHRDSERHDKLTLLRGGVILAVLIPVVYALGNHVVEHPELWRVFSYGLLSLVAFAGAAPWLGVFGLKRRHGVPCPHCHELLYRNCVMLGLISGNCCHCGLTLFEKNNHFGEQNKVV